MHKQTAQLVANVLRETAVSWIKTDPTAPSHDGELAYIYSCNAMTAAFSANGISLPIVRWTFNRMADYGMFDAERSISDHFDEIEGRIGEDGVARSQHSRSMWLLMVADAIEFDYAQ